MRLLFLVLIVACLAIQYPLWLGDTGHTRVKELGQQLQQQKATNQAMVARNNALQAEIDDLKTGTQALEDRARYEMSMIDPSETLIVVLPPNQNPPVIPIPIRPEAEVNPKPSTSVASSTKPVAESKPTVKPPQKSSNKAAQKSETTKPNTKSTQKPANTKPASGQKPTRN